jgi:hypothetical protein
MCVCRIALALALVFLESGTAGAATVSAVSVSSVAAPVLPSSTNRFGWTIFSESVDIRCEWGTVTGGAPAITPTSTRGFLLKTGIPYSFGAGIVGANTGNAYMPTAQLRVDCISTGGATSVDTTESPSGPTVVLNDLFTRADTAPGTLGIAETGQTWALSGLLFTQTQISNHAITSLTGASGPFYAYLNVIGPVVEFGAQVTFVAGSGTPGTIGGFEIIASDGVGSLLNHMIHPVNLASGARPGVTWWNGVSQNNPLTGCTDTGVWPTAKVGDVWSISVTRTGVTDYHYTETTPSGVAVEDCIGDAHVDQLWAAGTQPIFEAGSQVQTAIVPTFSHVWAYRAP